MQLRTLQTYNNSNPVPKYFRVLDNINPFFILQDMSTPDVRYEWNNHTSVLRTNCQELMLNDTYSDVTLFTAEGNKIPAHKIILSNASRYFKVTFTLISNFMNK